jgi:hypothetical protein
MIQNAQTTTVTENTYGVGNLEFVCTKATDKMFKFCSHAHLWRNALSKGFDA